MTILLRPLAALLATTLLALFLAIATPAAAQVPGLAGGGEAPAEAAVPSEEEIRELIATLEDEGRRDSLIRNLRALIAAAPEEEAPVVEAFGARALSYLSDQLGALGQKFGVLATAFGDAPRILAWFERQVADAGERERWLAVLLNIGLVLVLGQAARWLIRAVLSGPRAAIGRRRGAGVLLRAMLLVLRLALDLVPLAGYVLAAYVALGVTDPDRGVRLVTLSIVSAVLAIGLVGTLSHMLLAPRTPELRLFPLADETAGYLYVWVRRLTATVVLGYFAVEAAAALGLPVLIRNFLFDMVGLVTAALLVVLVLQNRRSFGAVLQGPRSGGGALGTLRRRLADIWHVLAIFYIVAMYAIFALNIEGGFTFMLRATVLTLVVFGVARLLTHGIDAAIHHGFSVPADLQAQFPHLEERANRYLPILNRALKAAVVVVAALAILQAWGLGGFEWLATETGRAAAGSVVSIAVVLLIAVVVWELASGLIERQLSRTDAQGNVIEQSGRIRTLLPLLRNALTVAIVVVVGLIVLSEIGVNIAPLLAGAGVVGLAIGFGSQALVKDVITGLFHLLGDTVSVGDVVDVGGHSGAVEAISIRAIRLRDLSGAVHVVPFGEITSIVNMTKDFSYYVFNIGVAYREDTDHVIEVVQQLGAELQAEPEYAAVILEPIEILGVDAFADSAVIVKARFKTRPIKQWMVGREFNRRLKKRFDELGIEIPFPHMTLYFGEDKKGAAPPAHLTLDAPTIAALADRQAPAPRRGGHRPMALGNTPDQRGDLPAESSPGHDGEDEPQG